jgi:hypothetical protein
MRKEIIAILAFSLLLGACERELPDNKLGKEVTVRVRLVGVAEGGEEDLSRSASTKEPEWVSTHTSDGMLLEMQLERDTSALRAQQTQLGSNSLFRVVALKRNSTTFISYADYKGDGTLVAGGLHVPINDNYDFVCYSYNTTTLPAAPTQKQGDNITTTINVLQSTKDLLWTKIPKNVGTVAPELEILLSRVMVRMKVVLDFNYNKWTITSISSSLTLGSTLNNGGTVLLTDGTVSATGTPTFTSWSGSGYQRESELLVMPKTSSSTITVNIPASAIARQDLSAIPASATTATFTAAELKAGFSYKLSIRLRLPIFARSNIYWDDTAKKLTFEPAADDPAQNVDTKIGYQGLFFKWGSLVGISPVGNWVDNSTPVYRAGETASSKYASWGAIPYWGDANNSTYGDVLDNTHTGQFVGDICQYLKPGVYQLPAIADFLMSGGMPAWTGAVHGWVPSSSFPSQTTSLTDGTANIIGSSSNQSYAKHPLMDNVIFPASGHRNYTTGELKGVGQGGMYWLRPKNTHMGHTENYCWGGSGGSASNGNYGCLVRCVKI